MPSKRIVVIGGSAAGPKAAAKARRLDEHAQIILFQKDPELSMASCGYPYYVGGVFSDRNMLLCTPTAVTRDSQFYLKAKAIDARVNTEVTQIDTKRRLVTFKNLITNESGSQQYDVLVVATGSCARMPDVPGVDLSGITTPQSINGIAGFIGENGALKAVKLQNGTELDCQLLIFMLAGVALKRCTG